MKQMKFIPPKFECSSDTRSIRDIWCHRDAIWENLREKKNENKHDEATLGALTQQAYMDSLKIEKEILPLLKKHHTGFRTNAGQKQETKGKRLLTTGIRPLPNCKQINIKSNDIDELCHLFGLTINMPKEIEFVRYIHDEEKTKRKDKKKGKVTLQDILSENSRNLNNSLKHMLEPILHHVDKDELLKA
jgi:hypothetical protein